MNNGLKGVFGAVVVIGLIGFRIYNATPHYREIESSTETVPAGQAWYYQMQVQRSGKVKFTITPKTDMEFSVHLMDQANYRIFQGVIDGDPQAMAAAANLDFMFQKMSNEAIHAEDIELKPGNYYIWVEAATEEPFTFDYSVHGQ